MEHGPNCGSTATSSKFRNVASWTNSVQKKPAGQGDICIEVGSSEEIRFIASRNQLLQTPNDFAEYFVGDAYGFGQQR